MKMMKIKAILLEGKVAYEPDTHSVYNVGDEKNQVTLAIPASLCFFDLLQKKGEIVSHDELLSSAWESRGMIVAPNTLYQNMSILRKSLISLGISSNIIKTVPKRGFVIPSDFPVEFIYETENTLPEKSQQEAFDKSKPPEVISAPPPEHTESVSRWVQNLVLTLICGLVVYSSYLVSNYLGEDTIPQYIAPDFVKIKSMSDCQIFRNVSLEGDEFFTKFMTDKNLTCGKEKWWYLTNYPPSLQVSLLRCSKELNVKSSPTTSLCVSDFYSESDQ
ncbi:DNA-binding winged helix-turn-helix (wHTH) protein [Rahnella sp. BIGb0236]|nr:DNA-binding winged helix-turn-helix (wHTH) protein [Rahnella sp. BIGb0236]